MVTSRQFKFSKKKIASLPPNEKSARSTNMEYSDIVPGLKLFVSKNGNKSFHYRYTINRRKRVIKIADFDCVPLEEVRDIARKYRGMVNRNLDPLEVRGTSNEVPTLLEFSKSYLEWSRTHKRSFKDDLSKFNKDLLPFFGSKRLNQITRKDVQEYLVKIKNRTSGTTSNRHRGLLSKIFSLASEWGEYDGVNPCKKIPKFPESAGRLRYLDHNEIHLLLNELNRGEPNVSKLLIKFLLFTGLRLGESKQIQEGDLMENGSLHIRMENAKSKKGRYVQLNSLALDVVRELQVFRVSGNPYIFPGRKRGQHITSPKKYFNTVKKKLNFDGVCLHSLRHTFATLSIKSGTNLYIVQAQLGHANFKTTERYCHISEDSLKDATENVAVEINRALLG